MEQHLGQQLGNYRLIRHLGQGSFADVYLGKHVFLETLAAVKILHTRLEAGTQEKFRQEAYVLAHLKHPHIVQVLDYGIEKGTPFLVMTYAPGGTLRERHPLGEQLPLTTILSYLEQIASALDYLHRQRLVHRDVKPANILVEADGTLLLSDFGLVSLAHTTGSLSHQEMAGTPAYMAPEQLQGHPRPASDQYALAVMVYEWATGKRPFQGSGWALYQQILSVSPPPLRAWVPALPPQVEAGVLRALSKKPQERFESVSVFMSACKQALPIAHSQETALSAYLFSRYQRIDRFRKRVTTGLLVLLLLFYGITVFFHNSAFPIGVPSRMGLTISLSFSALYWAAGGVILEWQRRSLAQKSRRFVLAEIFAVLLMVLELALFPVWFTSLVHPSIVWAGGLLLTLVGECTIRFLLVSAARLFHHRT